MARQSFEYGQRRVRLRRAVRVRSSFAGIAAMSHELREPMNGVLGMARLLAETALSPEQRALLDTVVDSAEALLTVLNDILDLSRVEAGRLELREAAYDPRLLLQRTVAPFVQKAAAKNLAFDLQIDPNLPPWLHGDPGRIRQILVNLLGNALKFTDAGAVRVAMHYRDGVTPRLLCDVDDTGPGLDDTTMARLFTAYGQADANTPRLFGGSGLGLMISYRLIQAMSGVLHVGSTPGLGTRFSVELPTRPVEATGLAVQPVSLAGLNLLVVEPTSAMRARLRRTLLGWGVGVRGAAGAKDAMREVQEARTRGEIFDLAVVSAMLADQELRDLIQSLRAATGAATRIICLATSGLRGDAARADALGFDGYLSTPFSDDALMQMLIRLAQATEPQRFWTRHDVEDRGDRSLRILVADDNPVNCRLAALLLEKTGHTVTTVADGAAAVAAVSAGGFDLVLMDVQMPGTDGLEAARQIRRLPDPNIQRIPIVALTAEAMPGDERRVLDAGMNGYLTKPIDRPKLLSTIQSWAARPAGDTVPAEFA